MARAGLSQGRRNAFAGQVQKSRQAQRFRKVRYRLRGRRSTFAIPFQISWQAQYFRKVRYRFRSRRSTFCKVRDRFAAGAILSQGAVQILRQAQHFRKRCQFRGRRSTFARYGAKFDAGAALNQWGRQPPHDARGSEDSVECAKLCKRSTNQQGGLGGAAAPPPHTRKLQYLKFDPVIF